MVVVADCLPPRGDAPFGSEEKPKVFGDIGDVETAPAGSVFGDVITDKLGTFGREWGAEWYDNALLRFEGKVGDPLEEGEVGVERRDLVEGVEKCANVVGEST